MGPVNLRVFLIIICLFVLLFGGLFLFVFVVVFFFVFFSVYVTLSRITSPLLFRVGVCCCFLINNKCIGMFPWEPEAFDK